jgi:alpha-galactosidase
MPLWTVSNRLLTCQVSLEDGDLRWALWRGDDATCVAVVPSAVPGLAIHHRTVVWDGQVNARESIQADGIRTLCIQLRARDGNLRLSRHFQVFPGQPFVRMWGVAENLGDTALLVTGSLILNMDVPMDGFLTLFHVEQFSWVYRRDFFSQNQVRLHPGRAPTEIRMGSFPSCFWEPTSCTWFALRDAPPDEPDATPQQGPGLVVGIEFNGKSRLRGSAEARVAHLTSTIDDLYHRIVPGEAFEVPACFVGLFDGDWDDAGYVTQRFAEAHIHPPMPDERYPWVQYNSWGYGRDIHEAQQLAAIERSAQMGMEAAVLDLGWAVQIGHWQADLVKFPRGLAPLVDRAHVLGLRFGIHMPLAQVHTSSPVAQQHPDWLIHEDDEYFDAAPLCLGHRPCRDWVIAEVLRLIDEYGLDYIVYDGEDMVKLCRKSTHTHEPGDSNYANSTEGLDVVIETVRQLRPHVVWENCEDGGCMLTYKMARLCHSTGTVDCIATYATRQGVYGASYPFSLRYSVRYMQDDPTPYTLRSAIFGGPLILMQRITEWDDEQVTQTAAAIAQYKELRTWMRDAKVIHLLAPRYNVEGVGWGWDAIQAVSSDQARSAVMVYRAMGGPSRQVIRPRGLRPGGTYRVQVTDRGDVFDVSADVLAREGVELVLTEFSSEMLRLDLQTLTRLTAAAPCGSHP